MWLRERSAVKVRRNTAGMSAGVWVVALAIALLHMLTNGWYGFHRDELQFLSDSRHMEWGFVAYPPLTAAVERVSQAVFGLWLPGLRLASVLAQGAVVLLAGGMARVCGGDRRAQTLAAFCAGCGTLALFEGTEFQYGSFDLLWCALLGYAVVRMLAMEDARWWLLAGVAAGLGLQTKYTMAFVAAGAVLGFAATPARRLLLNRWFAAALGLTLLIALPNFLWQVHHGFISLQFLEHIHKRDVRNGRGNGFWVDQFWLSALTMAAPVWIAGLWRAVREARWRPVAVFWAVPVLFFGFSNARGYYTGGVYPMLIALGAPVIVRWLAARGPGLRVALSTAFCLLLVADAALMCAVVVPLAKSGPLRNFALSKNDDLRAEFGWDEIVARVAAIRDSLPPEQRAGLGIVTGNYGAGGAVDVFGPKYGLPEAISTTNSAWLRTYPRDPQPTTLIVLGYSPENVEAGFTGCRVVETTANSAGVRGEEVRERPNIYLCGPPKLGWARFWQEWQSFG